MKVKPSKHLVVVISMLLLVPSSCASMNCSSPGPASLLRALQPAFELNSIRPVTNMSIPTSVEISFILFGILGVDEKAQILTTFIWLSLNWQSDFTLWNAEMCGMKWIAVPRNKLWVPDIVINEFMEKNTAPDVPYVYLRHDGRVFDYLPVRVVSSCRLDIYLFPFDVQNCTFTFNSFIHASDVIGLQSEKNAEEIFLMSRREMATMGEWVLTGIKSQKLVIPTVEGYTYHELHFYISIRRQSIMYVVNLLIPSCFLITVDLFSFVLPAQVIERALFKMTLVLGYTVFLLSTNELLPITGDTIPLINVFLSLCLCMMVTSLLETIIITNLLRGSAQYSPPPRWLCAVVLDRLGPLVRLYPQATEREDLLIQNPATREMRDFPPVVKEKETLEAKEVLNDEFVEVLKAVGKDLEAIHLQVVNRLKGGGTAEWIQIGLIIDRLLFFFYIFFLSISFITILIIWVNSYHTT